MYPTRTTSTTGTLHVLPARPAPTTPPTAGTSAVTHGFAVSTHLGGPELHPRAATPAAAVAAVPASAAAPAAVPAAAAAAAAASASATVPAEASASATVPAAATASAGAPARASASPAPAGADRGPASASGPVPAAAPAAASAGAPAWASAYPAPAGSDRGPASASATVPAAAAAVAAGPAAAPATASAGAPAWASASPAPAGADRGPAPASAPAWASACSDPAGPDRASAFVPDPTSAPASASAPARTSAYREAAGPRTAPDPATVTGGHGGYGAREARTAPDRATAPGRDAADRAEAPVFGVVQPAADASAVRARGGVEAGSDTGSAVGGPGANGGHRAPGNREFAAGVAATGRADARAYPAGRSDGFGAAQTRAGADVPTSGRHDGPAVPAGAGAGQGGQVPRAAEADGSTAPQAWSGAETVPAPAGAEPQAYGEGGGVALAEAEEPGHGWEVPAARVQADPEPPQERSPVPDADPAIPHPLSPEPAHSGVPGPGVVEIVAQAVARGLAPAEDDTQDLPVLAAPHRGSAVTELPPHLPFRAEPQPDPEPAPGHWPAHRPTATGPYSAEPGPRSVTTGPHPAATGPYPTEPGPYPAATGPRPAATGPHPAATRPRPAPVRRAPRGDERLREHRGPVLPGWIGVGVGGLALAGCTAVLWRAGVLPAPLVAAFGGAPRAYQGLRATHWPPLAFLGIVALLALGGLGRARTGHAWVLTLFGAYRGTVRRTGLTWISPLLLRRRVDVRLRHWRSDPMPAVDSGGLALQAVVQVVWQVKDTARAALGVEDHVEYLAEQVESAMARVLSQLPADAFHEDAPTLRDAEAVGEALTRMLAAETESVGIEVFSAQPTRIEYAPEVAAAMRRRRIAAIDAKHRDSVLTSVVDAVDDTVHRLTSRGLVELDDYERKALVKDLTVAFYTGRGE